MLRLAAAVGGVALAAGQAEEGGRPRSRPRPQPAQPRAAPRRAALLPAFLFDAVVSCATNA